MIDYGASFLVGLAVPDRVREMLMKKIAQTSQSLAGLSKLDSGSRPEYLQAVPELSVSFSVKGGIMDRRIRLGMLTPSSNTVLEPVTCRMLARIDGVTAHFSRFQVTEITLGAGSVGQFDLAPMLAAAKLLVDAKVDAIAWNGTSASWLGVERDRHLAAEIERETGIPATTSVLSLLDTFRDSGVRRYGLVTPYVADVQARILENFSAEGFECVAERHLDISDNFAFAEVCSAELRRMIREVAAASPDAVAVVCTNLAAAPLAGVVEAETGIAVHDSVAVTIRGALKRASSPTMRIEGWGRVLATV